MFVYCTVPLCAPSASLLRRATAPCQPINEGQRPLSYTGAEARRISAVHGRGAPKCDSSDFCFCFLERGGWWVFLESWTLRKTSWSDRLPAPRLKRRTPWWGRRGRLVQANTRDTAHLAHQLGHVHAGRAARVRGADSEGRVVGDHFGKDVQDGLGGGCGTGLAGLARCNINTTAGRGG